MPAEAAITPRTRLLIVNSVASRLERQANSVLRVREGSENAIIAALLDEGRIGEAAEAMGVEADAVRAVRQAVAESARVVVVFGDELRGAALEGLALLEGALPAPAGEAAEAARKAYIDALQRQVKSSNSTQKPAINENPYTYIVERPTLEVAAEPARFETKFSFVPLVRYANTLGAALMGMMAGEGKPAQAMLQAAGGDIKALVIAGEDVVGKANGHASTVGAQLAKLDFLVVTEMFLTETAKLADVVFPATSFAEAQGTQINNGLQVQFVRRAIPPVGQARPDWMIVSQLARAMGADLGYQGQLKNVFKEIAANVPGFDGLTHNLLANEGATQIRLAAPDAGSIDAAAVRDRLAGEVARVNKSLAVDRAPLTAQAGSRLKTRYPQITRHSEMLTPALPTSEEGKAAPVIFPA